MKYSIALLLSCAAVAPAVLAESSEKAKNISQLNIRTVNIVDMMRDSQEGVKVTAELEAMRTQLTQELKAAEDDYIKQVNAYQEKVKSLSPEAREKEQTRLMDKQRDIESKAKKSEDKLKYTMQGATERLGQKAQNVIAAYAKENNIDIVFDTASGRALWSSDKTDLTHLMVNTMDTNYKTELAQASKKDSTKVAAAAPKTAAKQAV